MTDPRSEAIRAMGEVIAAQALHIEKLEAGHWSKHTRKRVDRAKRQLDQITAGDASYIAPRIVQPAPQAKIPEEGMFQGGELPAGNLTGTHYPTPGTCTIDIGLSPEGAWHCTLPAGHGQMHHLVYTGPSDYKAELLYGDEASPKPRTIEDIDNDVARANDLHPTHTNNHLITDKWPATGYCARCDALQPLWDERQALLFAATRELRAAHGDYRTSPKASE